MAALGVERYRLFASVEFNFRFAGHSATFEIGGSRCSQFASMGALMQLTMKVNNQIAVKGAVRNKGVLSAIITVSVPASGNEAKTKAFIHAFESSDVLEWSAGELSIGDKVEIHLLPDCDADPPSKTLRSSDIPAFLFSDPDQARKALAKVRDCKEFLEGILQAAKHNEPHDEALKVQRAVVAVVQDLGKYLITPTLRRHPELLSEAKDLDLLD